jgi:hypothetical protein
VLLQGTYVWGGRKRNTHRAYKIEKRKIHKVHIYEKEERDKHKRTCYTRTKQSYLNIYGRRKDGIGTII